MNSKGRVLFISSARAGGPKRGADSSYLVLPHDRRVVPTFTGTRRSQVRNDAQVHTSLRTPLWPFPYTLTREVSDDEVPRYEVEGRGDRANYIAATSRAHISKRHLLLEPQDMVRDDDGTRHPPRATSTMKTEAFPLDNRTETISNIIHPRWAFPSDAHWDILG
ncbi:hypothetical protein CDL15_Pgr026275 [Punica granatum]|uniref:Uncharacterized protein n=1 Tax=Punica granatum TaxID=22663 RepID=A0A218XXU9_PUNGR|nr:hypothetical protein CDL15_Pgr026275 [Punica granatum]